MSAAPVVVGATRFRSRAQAALCAPCVLLAALALAGVRLPWTAGRDPFADTRRGAARHPETARWRYVVCDVSAALLSPPPTSLAGLRVDAHVAALALASALAGLGTSARGRPVRRGAAWTWGGLVVVGVVVHAASAASGWGSVSDAVQRPLLAAVVLAVATLGVIGAAVGLGRFTGLSGAVVLVAGQHLALVGYGVSSLRLDALPLLAADVAAGVVALGGGLWLVRRHDLGDLDLTGVLAACPTAAEVALLPYAWSRAGELAAIVSLPWASQVAPGWAAALPEHLDLVRLATSIAAVLALGAILARRERRDRGA